MHFYEADELPQHGGDLGVGMYVFKMINYRSFLGIEGNAKRHYKIS